MNFRMAVGKSDSSSPIMVIRWNVHPAIAPRLIREVAYVVDAIWMFRSAVAPCNAMVPSPGGGGRLGVLAPEFALYAGDERAAALARVGISVVLHYFEHPVVQSQLLI